MSRVALLAALLCACGGDVTFDPGAGDGAVAQPPPTTELEFCVTETNRYRAMVGKVALAHSAELEAYATAGAEYDTLASSAHKHFGDVPGVSFAENECPSFLGWTVNGNVHDTIAGCLKAFFDEGPGGGHYENLISDRAGVGCGVYLSGSNGITITQDFR